MTKELKPKTDAVPVLEADQTWEGEYVERLDLEIDDRVTLDKKSMVLRNATMLGYESANGRTYSERSADSLCRLSEGQVMMIAHHGKGPKGERSPDEILGMSSNMRNLPAEKRVRGDIHYRKCHEDLIEFLYEKKVRGVGPSIRGRARFRGRGRGQTVLVEDYLAHRSIDLVIGPGTVDNIRESVEPPQPEVATPTEGVTPMEVKDLKEQLDRQTAQSEGLSTKLDKVMESLASEKKAREIAEAKSAKNVLVNEALDEAGKDIPKESKATIRAALERCDDKAGMLTLLGAFTGKPVNVQETNGIATGGNDPTGGTSDKFDVKAITEDLQESLSGGDTVPGFNVHERR